MSLSFWFPVLSLAARVSFAQTSLTLSPPAKAANADVSSALDPSFAGFGIEPSNLFSFTGGDDANTFSVQLMQNLADYSGAPPHIRLGGNTQDYFIFDSSYDDLAWKKNAQSSAQGKIAADSMIIGPGYFKALDRFPKDTPITFGLNLAYEDSDYIDRIVASAQGAVDGMQNVKLYSFEIGNEPDLYLENNFRSGSWDGKTWTEEFLERADAVYNQVLKPAGLPTTFFEPPATASTIGTTFEIDLLVEDGLTAEKNGNKYILQWNQHDYFYFIGVTQDPLTLNDLMDFDATNTQFAYWEKQVGIALKTGLPYVLREMSSVGPIGMHLVSDTLGAALWTLNFFLYTASINISSVQMHMTDNSNASAWQPIDLYGNTPFVRPQYYAHAAMAQIIGNGNGTTQIGVIDTADVGSDYTGRIRAYSAYANGNLQAVVLINGKQANASTGDKGSFSFEVDFGSDNKDKTVFLSELTAEGADSLSGTTWNGMSFADATGKASVVDQDTNTVRTSSSGKATISVRDSQAIVANVGSLLGSNAVRKADGTTTEGSRKQSTAGPTNTGGANTAAWTGVVTTTLALAGSISGGGDGNAEETGTPRHNAQAVTRRSAFWTMMVCLVAVMIGFVYLA